jgi:hypothetical protein
MFAKDNRTENFLTGLGVTFRYTNAIKEKDLIEGWEKNNLARPVNIREEAVLEYATLFETGSLAPAVIVAKTQKGYRVLDGVQRLIAVRMCKYNKLSAYVVETDDEDTLVAINVLANARLQGRPEPAEWTRRRACEVLVMDRGMDVHVVATWGGWQPWEIERQVKTLRYKRAVAACGGPDLSDACANMLAQRVSVEDIQTTPEPIVRWLRIAKKAKYSASALEAHAEAMFRPTNKKTAHATYSKRVAVFENDEETQARLKGRKGPAMRKDIVLKRTLQTALEQIRKLVDPPINIDEFFRLINKIEGELKALSPKHGDKNPPRTPADKWSPSNA